MIPGSAFGQSPHQPIRVVIVEDNANIRELIRSYLTRFFGKRIDVIGEAADVDDSIVLIRRMKPQLLLLDIELLTGTCFDILEILGEEERKHFSVVFITQYESYVRQALRYGVVDYIDKPILSETFIQGIEHGIKSVLDRESGKVLINLHPKKEVNPRSDTIESKNIQQNTPAITVRYLSSDGEKLLNIPIIRITHCQAKGSYTEVFQSQGLKVIDSRPLKRYEEMLLQHDFVRISRSLLVNPLYCQVQRNGKRAVSVVLPDGTYYDVMRSYKERLLAYLSSKG